MNKKHLLRCLRLSLQYRVDSVSLVSRQSVLAFLLVFLTAFSGTAWATDYQLAYTIELQPEGSSNDGRTTSNFVNDVVTSGSSYINACTATANAYPAGGFVKLGSSSKTGSFTLSLATNGQVKATKVILSAKYYDSGKTIKLTVNDKDSIFTPTNTFADYELLLDGKTNITSISVTSVTASKGRMYVNAIKVYTAAAPQPGVYLEPNFRS